MILSDTDIKILNKVYDICFLSLNDEIAVKLLYEISSKNYLWMTIKELEQKGIIKSYKDHNKKYISLTCMGKRIIKALQIIRNS